MSARRLCSARRLATKVDAQLLVCCFPPEKLATGVKSSSSSRAVVEVCPEVIHSMALGTTELAVL